MKRLFLTGNYRKKQLSVHLPRICSWLMTKKVIFYIDEHLKEYCKSFSNSNFISIDQISEKQIDLIVTFGGDGTILYTAQYIQNRQIPLIGVNLGGLGFLADIGIDTVTNALEYVLHGEYKIETRSVLKIETETLCRYAVNDIVFDKAGFRRVIELEVLINNLLINAYIADGLIVATPTGSTGYNLSAGGPIVVPSAEVNIISPICPHSLTARPLIVPNSEKLTITVNTEAENFICNTDGQEFGKFSSGQLFHIQNADFRLQLIKIEGHDFYSILRNKLRWGYDFRDKKRWSFKTE